MAESKKLAKQLKAGDRVLLEEGSAVVEAARRGRAFRVELEGDVKFAIEVTYRGEKGMSVLHPNEEVMVAA